MLQAVDAVGHGVLRGVLLEVSGNDHATAMALLDNATAHGALEPDMKLQCGDPPLLHVLDERRHGRRVRQCVPDVLVKRRIAVDERAGQKYPGRTIRMSFRETSHAFFGHDLVTRASHRGDAGREKERQYLIAGRSAGVDWQAVDDVIFGCANQAGEDNRNVARMALLLAGLPKEVPGSTVNRLCGSSMDAVGVAARAIKSGETELMIAGGVESMSRAPFVMGKADTAFSRSAEIFDTTIGWRFVNPLMKSKYGVDSMPETAENVAEDFKVSREDQDAFRVSHAAALGDRPTRPDSSRTN